MDTITRFTVYAASGALSVIGGTASQFVFPLSHPATFNGQWRVSVASLTCPKGTLDASIFVYLDGVIPQQVGGDVVPVVFRAAPYRSGEAEPIYRTPALAGSGANIPRDAVWRSLNIRLADSLGLPLTVGTHQTIIEFIFEQVAV